MTKRVHHEQALANTSPSTYVMPMMDIEGNNIRRVFHFLDFFSDLDVHFTSQSPIYPKLNHKFSAKLDDF